MEKLFETSPLSEKTAPTLLDIGPHLETLIIPEMLPQVHISTMGYDDRRFVPASRVEHIQFDLNDSYYVDRWPTGRSYDVIVLWEVIEHLYTSPVQVLGLLNSLLNESGFLVVSMPNAAYYRNRINLLRGRNPFEMIREDRTNPGHYREYTVSELIEIGNGLKLKPYQIEIFNSSIPRSLRGKSLNALLSLLPDSLKRSVLCVFKKGNI